VLSLIGDFFFLLFSSNVQGCSVNRHQIFTHLMMTRIYKMGSEIWGTPIKIGGAKTPKFGSNVRELLGNLIAHICGMKHDIQPSLKWVGEGSLCRCMAP